MKVDFGTHRKSGRPIRKPLIDKGPCLFLLEQAGKKSCIMLPGCKGKILLPQSPKTLAAFQGDFFSITCRSSYLHGLVSIETQRATHPQATHQVSGIPTWFQEFDTGSDFSLSIHGVGSEDSDIHYFQKHFSRPPQ